MNEKIKLRILSRIEKTENGCWEYTWYRNKKGYGVMSAWGKLQNVHRISYIVFKKDIEKGKQLDHLCRNRSCVNPGHLEEVSLKENVLRGIGIAANNSRKKKCKYGHLFDSENTIVMKDGHRNCRKCKREYQKKYMKKYNKDYYQKHKVTVV